MYTYITRLNLRMGGLVTDIKSKDPLEVKSLVVDIRSDRCKGVGMVLESNIGIEYGILVSLVNTGEIKSQKVVVL